MARDAGCSEDPVFLQFFPYPGFLYFPEPEGPENSRWLQLSSLPGPR